MSRLPSLPDIPHLNDVFRRFPRGVEPLMTYIDGVLRGPSELSVGERELLAAYVSALNACSFCQGSHLMFAQLHGIDPEQLEKILNNPGEAGLEDKWLPLLAYIRKLTESPAQVTDADARAVLNAGVSEDALFDAISVCGVFNLMNRIVEGCGVQHTEESTNRSQETLDTMRNSPTPYLDFARRVIAD